VLLQESTEQTWVWEATVTLNSEDHETGRQTRAAFAPMCGDLGAVSLETADELSDYVRTMSRSSFARWMAELDAEEVASRLRAMATMEAVGAEMEGDS
jgi:hypothetical protein